jgi:hypothetical protein
MPLLRPAKHLLFRSPLPKGEGVKQALAWNREQLLDLRQLWELCRQRRVSARLLPMTQPPMMISDAALGVENNDNTVTVTPLSSLIPHSTSHLDSQCGGPFSPTAWRGLTSIVRRPQRWQVDSSMPLKTTKMLLRFRQPITTEKRLHALSRRDLDSKSQSLPKGWVYEVEDTKVKTEAEVVDPSSYLTSNTPLTRLKRKRQLDNQSDDPYHQHHRASNIIEAPHSSLSASKRTAMKHRRITSRLTSMPPIPS